MTKYQYYVNGKPMTKMEMAEQLKRCCYKVISTTYIGEIGIDTSEFDEKKFNRYLRKICSPSYAFVMIGNKSFYRKKI